MRGGSIRKKRPKGKKEAPKESSPVNSAFPAAAQSSIYQAKKNKGTEPKKRKKLEYEKRSKPNFPAKEIWGGRREGARKEKKKGGGKKKKSGCRPSLKWRRPSSRPPSSTTEVREEVDCS